jgi:pentatricopeptide repeat protein
MLKKYLPQTKESPKVAFYNKNLAHFVTQGQYDKAEVWFYKMKTDGVAPSLATYTLLLWMYSREATNIVALSNLMNELRDSGLELSRTPYAITLHAYAEHQMVNEINELVRDMDERKIPKDLVIYNILIEAYGRAAMGDQAIQMYDKMKEEGVRPSEITFNLLFDVCGFNGRIERANGLWKEMTDVYPYYLIY